MSEYYSMDNSCVCGYKHKGNYGVEPVEGDEPFKRLRIEKGFSITSESTDHKLNGGYEDESKVFLISCPKCGTVKVGGDVW